MTATKPDYPYARAASAGIASGMRGMMAFTAIAYAARASTLDVGDGRLGWLLRSPAATAALSLAAAGELVVDKLPMTPDRLRPGPLSGRIVVGGVTGAIVSRGRGGSPLIGAVAGSLAALASSWVFGRGRARIGALTGIPDPIVAVGEDVLAIAVAAIATAASPDAA